MDYPLENLGPEKFQLFCQALLLKEYPGVRCFPVAQPDGGRDATRPLYLFGKAKEFVMYQVKFVRNPAAISEPGKWIREIMEDEIPKIKAQALRGAKAFVMLTNVAGSAHLDYGSIDIAEHILESNLSIPATCLWRNDLNRRLDGAWDLKWSYPELMTGPDMLRLLTGSESSEASERRRNAIRAFLTHQFALDYLVKFKQVDLSNGLLDLFIDVPAFQRVPARWPEISQFTPNGVPSWLLRDRLAKYSANDGQVLDDVFDPPTVARALPDYWLRSRSDLGAATLILSDRFFMDNQSIVLEGAPGQGKSTIAQYVCQVHRIRILGKIDELSKIPGCHQECPVKLPIRVDLRDFAVWMAKRNPFDVEDDGVENLFWERSLESFLAALIRNQAGGFQFSVADLHSLARTTSLLLVLDGLDEVANIEGRAEVVAEILKGSDRLRSSAAYLQVVVTSRPAAFENSPGLPEGKFKYYCLDSVSPELVEDYTNRWLKARMVSGREGSEVKKVFRDKLGQRHLKELARNPMQLAILLSLIHSRGVSLPDKRTALYDSYVELFFNRESEKNDTIRRYRDLLVDIHRYLGWLLHVEAEQGGVDSVGRPSGAIEEARLKDVLRSYLLSEGRRPELVDELFVGMVERVVAIVSRVQGTYEFEVQPLREYFAARFLHETAPYSPVGAEKIGTWPDRFDALARNFYWLNVTRFYAGCYSKGELPSLIDRLEELIRDEDFRLLSYSRTLGAMLLSDWVFAQNPKSVAAVVRLILDDIGLRFVVSSSRRRQLSGVPLVLPLDCGHSELVAICFEMLREVHPADFDLELVDLLKANATRDEVRRLWMKEVVELGGSRLTRWLEFGLQLGCLPTLPLVELEEVFHSNCLDPRRIEILFRARRSDYFSAEPARLELALFAVLDQGVTVGNSVRTTGLVERLSQILDLARYSLAFVYSSGEPLNEVARNLFQISPFGEEEKGVDSWQSEAGCRLVIEVARELGNLETATWSTRLAPWEKLVDSIVDAFGERRAARLLAILGAGIRSMTDACLDAPELFDSGVSLCRRTRYARLRAGTASWWGRQFARASTVEMRVFLSEVFFTWAGSVSISSNISNANFLVEGFSAETWANVYCGVREVVTSIRRSGRGRAIEVPLDEGCYSSLSPRVLALLRLRARPVPARLLYEQWLSNSDASDIHVLEVFQNDALEHLSGGTKDIEKHLDVLSRGYRAGVLSSAYLLGRYSRRESFPAISFAMAKRILEFAGEYPSFLVAAAEMRCRRDISKRVKPLAEVASKEGWFR